MTSGPNGDVQASRAFHEAINLDLRSGSVSICLIAAGNDSEADFKKLETSPELADNFRDILQEFCDDAIEDGKTARTYAPDQKPNDERVQFVKFSDYPDLRSRIEQTLNPGTLSPFVYEDSFVRRLNYYAIVVQIDEDATLIGLRTMTPAQKPGKGKWGLKAILDEYHQRYRTLDTDPFLFDREIDCLVYGDYVFIANRSKFEQIFSFDQKTREVASQALSRLEEIEIANFEDFRKMCLRDRRKQRMLAPIERPDTDLSYVTVETAKNVIETNRELQSIVQTIDGKEVLGFDTSRQWDLLRFLKQSTVRSVASGSAFEVDGDMRSLG